MNIWEFLRKFDNIKNRKTKEFYEIVHKELMKKQYTEESIRSMGNEYADKIIDVEKFIKEKDGLTYIYGNLDKIEDKEQWAKVMLLEKNNRLEHWIVEKGEDFYNRVRNEGLVVVKNYFIQNNFTIDDLYNEHFIYDVFYPTIDRKKNIIKEEVFSMIDDLSLGDIIKIKDYIGYLEYKRELDEGEVR